MKRALLTLVVVAVVGGSVYVYYSYRKSGPKPSVATAPVTRGAVVDTVGATGTLQAVTTVQVGTQVSGTIQSLYADFNSLVKKGQVLARLDPSLFQTQIEQARANLVRAQADVERLRVSVDDARTKLARARELSQRSLIPKTDLETAEVNVRSAEAQTRSADAQVTQAQASLNQNQVNLQHTVIEAPIDGLVISRNVDVGQTVAASMQAPTLFVLAADLTKMQVVANLDESDVGRIRPGQHVTFRVDAYPAETFDGNVSQVRLEPKVQQNVVTYATVIDVPNNDLKLKPGMTANVNVEIARATNVLRVPNAALRFRPTNEIFAALGQAPPEQGQRGEFAGMRRGGGGPGGPAGATTPAPAGAPVASSSASASSSSSIPAEEPRRNRRPQSDDGSSSSAVAAPPATGAPPATAAPPADESENGGHRGRRTFENMSAEEREQMFQRMRERGFDPSTVGGGNFGGHGGDNPNAAGAAGAAPARERRAAPARAEASTSARKEGATTIDALFAPLPRTESVGRAWLYVDKQLRPIRLRLGISDGQNTELIEGDVKDGTEVVTNVTTGAETRPAATGNFPFGQPGRGGFPGGGFPGGGFPGGGFPGGGNRGRGR